MSSLSHRPLLVGDHVRFRGTSAANPPGVIIEVLPDDYVRVRWPELPRPTVHRAHSLCLVAMSDASCDTPTVEVPPLPDTESGLGE